MRSLSRATVCLLFLSGTVVSSGCDRDEPWRDPGPREVFDSFLMHWFRGEADLAFDYILPEDRDALTEPLEDWDLDDEQRPEPHEMLVVAAVDNAYDVTKKEVRESLDKAPLEGERVTVVLHYQDGSRAEAQLVWSDGRWYVDLPLQQPGS